MVYNVTGRQNTESYGERTAEISKNGENRVKINKSGKNRVKIGQK